MAIFFHGFHVFAFCTVQLGAFEQDFFDTACHRAMRIFFSFTFSMVFAMYRRPFLSHLACRQPQPETEKMTGDCMQLQGAMCLTAMQEDGHTGNRDMCHDHSEDEDLPASGAGQAIGQKINYGIDKSAQNDMYSIVIDDISVDFAKPISTIISIDMGRHCTPF
jgi:hypothetical protein